MVRLFLDRAGPRFFRVLALILLSAMAGACGSDSGSDPDPETGQATTSSESSSGSDEPEDSDQDQPDTTSTTAGTTEPERSVIRPINLALPERAGASASPEPAGSAITSFGFDLFSAARRSAPAEDGAQNLTLSPASVAIALAMLEPGTVEDAQGQLRALLAITDADRFHASMNSLQQSLEAREPSEAGDQDPGEITVRVANAAYLQEGYPFEEPYLEAIGGNYGPVLYEVDFAPDPDAVARGINDFVANATKQQITDLIADGVISPDTVLALVNALYFKASWLEPFQAADTTADNFTRLDGSTVGIDMMQGFSGSSAEGDGWVGATKSYTGGLDAQFILPDEGRFDEVAADLSTVFDEYDRNRSSQEALAVPRFEVRSSVQLDEALQALGFTAPYENGGLLGIADDPRLVVDKIIHETFVAMDEQGTEAAAATVVLTFPTSGPPSPPVPVILDRPFLYRIIDRQTGATLFMGQILDPTA